MSVEKQVRRAPKISNWMIALGLAAVALAAYALIAVRVKSGWLQG
jgi:hypothetical protein